MKGRSFAQPGPELPPPRSPVRRYVVEFPEDIADYIESICAESPEKYIASAATYRALSMHGARCEYE